jgi:hypothetical protein
MGEYSIPAVSDYGCVFISGEEEDLEKIEKFNALKASRPEVAADLRYLWNLHLRRSGFKSSIFLNNENANYKVPNRTAFANCGLYNSCDCLESVYRIFKKSAILANLFSVRCWIKAPL